MESVELRILLNTIGTASVDELKGKMDQLKTSGAALEQSLTGVSASSTALNSNWLIAAGTAGILAGAIGGLAQSSLALVQEQGKLSEGVANLSDRLGMSVGQTERLSAAAEIAGVRASSFEGAALRLSAALEDQDGAGKKAAAALRQLGVGTETLSGQQRNAGEVLLDVVRKLEKTEDSTQRAFLATQILGRGGAKELIPLINNFTSLEEWARKAGIGMNEGLTKQLAAADDEFDKLTKSIGQLKKELAADLKPFVVPIVVSLTGMINDPKGAMASGLQAAGSGLSGASGVAGPLQGVLSSLGQLFGFAGDALDSSPRERSVLKENGNVYLPPLPPPDKEKFVKQSTAGDLRLYDLFAKDAERNGRRRGNPSLYSGSEAFERNFMGTTLGTFISPESSRDPLMNSDAAFASGLGARGEADYQKRLQYEQMILSTREKLIQLTAGPGGELAAAQKIRDLKLATAKDEIEAARANLDYQTQVAEIAAKQRQEWRNTNGQIYQALRSGPGGFSRLATGYLDSIGMTAFQNLGDMAYGPLQGKMSIPGQGTADDPSFLGKLLKGTPLGLDPLKATTDANTTATIQNTVALARLSVAVGGGGGGFGGGLGSILGGVTSNPLIYNMGGGDPSLGGGESFGTGGVLSDIDISNSTVGSISTGSTGRYGTLGKTVGYAGAIAGGTFGTLAGVKQGGLRGAVTAGGSLAGAAAGILTLAGVSGPAAPILAAVGLGLGLVSSLFPDPKKSRDAAISREIESRRFSDFTGTSYNSDGFGRGFDYDMRGNARPIVVQINALDTQSIVDRRSDIADAVRSAMTEAHPLVKEIQSTVIPAQ